jgi:hypothetical protein
MAAPGQHAEMKETAVGRGWVVLITIAALAAIGLPVVFIVSGSGESADASVTAELDRIRAATEKYKDVKVARRDGYEAAPTCLEAEDGSGGMGIHYSKPSLNDDKQINLLKPEQLLYEPGKNGGPPTLAGVEYFAPYDGQRPPDTGLGHLDGPMPGHFPGQPKHFDLHVWIHRDNPDGTFSIWNSNVSCDPK